MIFSFLHPQYLFLLFAIPIIFIIHFFSLNNRKKIALKFANFDAISRIQGIDFFSKNIIILSLSVLIVLLMILAVSGLSIQVFKKSSSFSFVIVIDSSESMEADDFKPDRITVAKQTAIDFVNEAPIGVRIGVVSFSGNSYIRQDISEDKTEIKNSINSINIESWGGTDIYEAIITSTNLLYDEENKAIILLSDGQINVGKLEDIIDYANENKVLIHTIAIGTTEGGRTSHAISKLDEDSLKSISYNTYGEYFLAENKEELSQSFLNILDLTKKKVSIKLSNYLILFAIVLFIIKFFLANTRYLNIF
jgi:Ca-activated chloride channel homolog